ncbi:copper resistance protein B [Sphingomonas oligophenolica]|uniref:Copper resistance protein B n=1 Tax=Sphingomonas oligophenolica TaxID=301154 RepID=A0ABU9YBP6_9SPHN
MKILIAALLLGAASPAWAQQNEHAMPGPAPMNGSAAMPDHGAMGPMAATGPAMKETPPPPEAGSGPARAADSIWGAEAMRRSRAELTHMHGGASLHWFQADRFEYRGRAGKDGYLWDAQGYVGGDLDKLWVKSEGEGRFGQPTERAEVQALWSHAVAPFFDLQAGVRQDLAGPRRTHAVIGIQGLAPGMFEIDAAAFLSHRGDLTARAEVELDQRITQRLILQPRVELNLSAQDIPRLQIGAGLDRAELGVRLRYEIVREFAPYVGIEQEWRAGRSADYAHAAGDGASSTNIVMGVRFWL